MQVSIQRTNAFGLGRAKKEEIHRVEKQVGSQPGQGTLNGRTWHGTQMSFVRLERPELRRSIGIPVGSTGI